MPRLLPLILAAFIALPLLHAQTTKGPDWPCWQGPAHDNHSPDTNLLDRWPTEGPTLLWTAKGLGGGYSTPTMDHERIFGMGSSGDSEVIWAIKRHDGTPLWTKKIAKINKAVDFNQGPRSSPTLAGDRLYALGVSGDLVCLRATDGELVWRKNLVSDFGGAIPSYKVAYGYSESPLIEGDTVLVTPGGQKHTVVALDQATGAERWSASAPLQRFAAGTKAAYSSLVPGEAAGVKQYVQFLHGGVASFSDKGEFLWRWDRLSSDMANCVTPIFSGDLVFTSAGYNKGCGVVRIVRKDDKVTFQEVWFNKAMQNVHGGLVLVDGYVYGSSDPGLLVCVELATGKKMWSERSVGRGSILYADHHLYYRSEDGPMHLLEANPARFVETGHFDPPDHGSAMAWSHPVVIGGKMYLRDQDVLLCYDVGK